MLPNSFQKYKQTDKLLLLFGEKAKAKTLQSDQGKPLPEHLRKKARRSHPCSETNHAASRLTCPGQMACFAVALSVPDRWDH